MATTAQTVINASARKCGFYDSGGALSAQQSADALEALNNMLSAWESQGIAMGSSAIATLATNISAPDYALEAIEYNLAVRMAPEWQVTLPPPEEDPEGVVARAKAGLQQLRNQAVELIEADMQHLPRRIYVFNIQNG